MIGHTLSICWTSAWSHMLDYLPVSVLVSNETHFIGKKTSENVFVIDHCDHAVTQKDSFS